MEDTKWDPRRCPSKILVKIVKTEMPGESFDNKYEMKFAQNTSVKYEAEEWGQDSDSGIVKEFPSEFVSSKLVKEDESDCGISEECADQAGTYTGQIPSPQKIFMEEEVEWAFAEDPYGMCDPLATEDEQHEEPPEPAIKEEEPEVMDEAERRDKLEIPEGEVARDPLQLKQEELEIPEDYKARNPQQVKKEELNYESVATANDNEQESPVQCGSSTDGSGTPATRVCLEAGTGHIDRLTAKQEDFCENESEIRQQVLGCENDSAQLLVLEERRHVEGDHSPLSSSMCNKTFRLNPGERPHSCSICSKSFSQAGNLKTQSLVHTGERPHSCSICSKSFSTAGSLKTHSLVHTGERPHSCSICSKSFSTAGNLKRHMLVHIAERPHSCSICSKSFSTAGNLETHSLVHTGEHPYSCSVCSKTFSRSSSLKKHSLLHKRQHPHNYAV